MFLKNLKKLSEILAKYKELDLPALYHVTTLSNAELILSEGLKTDYKGKNHSGIELQPPEKMIYLSKYPNSNNLNCSLFDSGEKLVSLLIDPSCINKDDIYPDDGMFSAISDEALFFDTKEVMSTFKIPRIEAKEVIKETYELRKENVPEWQDLACWYLHEEGEISTPNNIDKKFISFSHYL